MPQPGKETIKRLERPEQLEDLVRFTSTRSWLALASMCIAVALAVLWGIFGEIHSTVHGEAIFLTEGGLFQIVAKESGHVQECKIRPGDSVKVGQIVAIMSNPQLEQQISVKQASIEVMEENRVRQTQMIIAKAEAQKRVLETQRLELLQKKVFIERRFRALDERVRTYAELLKEQAVPRQAYLTAKLDFEKASEDGALAETNLNEVVSKRRELDATTYDQIFQLKFKVDSAKGELESLQKKLDLTTAIRSDLDGRVVEVLAKQGQLVREGQAVMTCQGTGAVLEVEIFVPTYEGKKVLPGMRIQVTPSIVQREEYGFITGKVESVSLFPISREALISWLKNEKLVDSIMAKGPVLSVMGTLDEDSSTKSGFHWSSSKGADVTVTVGTMGSAKVVVLKQPPMALVLPMLKKWLGV
ncbi:MAG: NHLP bacteriocin system secretion protein [Desulfomonilaceae bacterium]